MCVRDLWFYVDKVLTSTTGNHIKLTCFDVMFGFDILTDKALDVNNFIMHVKYFIWKQKCQLLAPSYRELKNYIAKKKYLEESLETIYEHMIDYDI